MERCLKCVWANLHVSRGKVVMAVCPFSRCIKVYGWSARREMEMPEADEQQETGGSDEVNPK